MHPGKIVHNDEFSRDLVAGKVHAAERFKLLLREHEPALRTTAANRGFSPALVGIPKTATSATSRVLDDHVLYLGRVDLPARHDDHVFFPSVM